MQHGTPLRPGGDEDRIERARLAALRRYEVLDTAPEPAFDTLTALLRATLDAPVAQLSLVDESRLWLKSVDGAPYPSASTPRSLAFCSHAIMQDEPLVIPDTARDARFESNPLVVDDPRIRFYAGAPLVTPEGLRLGTMCVISPEPRPSGLSARDLSMLRALSAAAMERLEMRLGLLTARRQLEAARAEAARLRNAVALQVRREKAAQGLARRPGRPPIGPEVLDAIRREAAAGAPPKDVARRLGVSVGKVRSVVAAMRREGTDAPG